MTHVKNNIIRGNLHFGVVYVNIDGASRSTRVSAFRNATASIKRPKALVFYLL